MTGKTLGENLEELKQNGFYERCEDWLPNVKTKLQKSSINFPDL